METFAGLSGNGSVSLAVPRIVPALGVVVTTLPHGYALLDGGAPNRIMKVGSVAVCRQHLVSGSTLGTFCQRAAWIDFDREVIEFAPPGTYVDSVRYHVEPGGVISIHVDTIGDLGVPNVSLDPWDRNAVLWTQSAVSNPNGSVGTTQQWSYTVPSGKRLWLTHAEVQTQREVIATTPLTAYCFQRVNGITLIQAQDWANVVGTVQRDALQNGPMVLLAGQTIEAWYFSNNTGGRHTFASYASGLLFDA